MRGKAYSLKEVEQREEQAPQRHLCICPDTAQEPASSLLYACRRPQLDQVELGPGNKAFSHVRHTCTQVRMSLNKGQRATFSQSPLPISSAFIPGQDLGQHKVQLVLLTLQGCRRTTCKPGDGNPPVPCCSASSVGQQTMLHIHTLSPQMILRFSPQEKPFLPSITHNSSSSSPNICSKQLLDSNSSEAARLVRNCGQEASLDQAAAAYMLLSRPRSLLIFGASSSFICPEVHSRVEAT
ncbi:hypothetical protein TREES_T100012932 [Tupaia chinensis]|uniref:Uncharacterized protein n=1 Tax=Tupaia chinensis TaxID=246437 RepID=L9L7L6_TUPCH|nr:hypothetical protein TREES_T100012932 [Tupaia chinensis]